MNYDSSLFSSIRNQFMIQQMVSKHKSTSRSEIYECPKRIILKFKYPMKTCLQFTIHS